MSAGIASRGADRRGARATPAPPDRRLLFRPAKSVSSAPRSRWAALPFPTIRPDERLPEHVEVQASNGDDPARARTRENEPMAPTATLPAAPAWLRAADQDENGERSSRLPSPCSARSMIGFKVRACRPAPHEQSSELVCGASSVACRQTFIVTRRSAPPVMTRRRGRRHRDREKEEERALHPRMRNTPARHQLRHQRERVGDRRRTREIRGSAAVTAVMAAMVDLRGSPRASRVTVETKAMPRNVARRRFP